MSYKPLETETLINKFLHHPEKTMTDIELEYLVKSMSEVIDGLSGKGAHFSASLQFAITIKNRVSDIVFSRKQHAI